MALHKITGHARHKRVTRKVPLIIARVLRVIKLDWAKNYLVGLTTVTEPPKFRLLLCVAAIIAAAIAPPAAASSAINAPPLRCPKVSVLVSLVQRVPGCGVPADSEVPAATAFVLPPVRNSTEPP